MSDTFEALSGMAVFGIFILALIFIVHLIRADTLEQEAIKHNCAQYNTQTGAFEWRKIK